MNMSERRFGGGTAAAKKRRLIALLLAAVLSALLSVQGQAEAATMHISASGGVPISQVATVSNQYPGCLRYIGITNYNYSNVSTTSGWGTATVGGSARWYKVFSGDNQVNAKFTYPGYLKLNDKYYDVVLTIRSVNVDGTNAVRVSKDWMSIGIAQETSMEWSPAPNITGSRSGNKEIGWTVNIYEAGTSVPAKIKNIYIGLNDIDADNDSVEVMKLDNWTASAGNTFVNSYSSDKIRHAAGSLYGTASSSDNINAYVKPDSLASSGAVSGYYGWRSTNTTGGAMSFAFYVHDYTVSYKTDGGGSVSLAAEKKLGDENPSGSIDTPNAGYRFSHWTVDKQVTLEGGKVIPAGTAITAEEIKQVLVNSDLVFTAHHIKNPQVEISKTADKLYYQKGDYVTYTIKAGNGVSGSWDEDVVIKDELPKDLQLVNYRAKGDVDVKGNSITCTIGRMEGEETVMTLRARVLADSGTVNNTAEIEGKLSPEKRADTAEIRVVKPELKITKTADKSSYEDGDTIHYTIEVTNVTENSHADDIIIKDSDLSQGGSFVPGSVKTDAGDVTEKKNAFSVEVPILSYGEKVTITADAKVDASKAKDGKIVNTASAEWEQGDKPVTDKVSVDVSGGSKNKVGAAALQNPGKGTGGTVETKGAGGNSDSAETKVTAGTGGRSGSDSGAGTSKGKVKKTVAPAVAGNSYSAVTRGVKAGVPYRTTAKGGSSAGTGWRYSDGRDPDTGDDSDALMYGLIALGAFYILRTILWRRRRDRMA